MLAAVIPLVVSLLLADVDVVVTPKDGPVAEGRAHLGSIEIKTDYGRAVVEEEHLASIEFGETDTIRTDSDATIKGHASLDSVKVEAVGGTRSIVRANLGSLVVVRRAALKPGEITDGVAPNRLTYHLRAPDGFHDGQRYPAILILHGSNMTSKAYVNTIAAAWPDIARDYLLIGIDGENRNTEAQGDEPVFNYTYVNFVGKSKFKGYPGTDRESPALVSEALNDLRKSLPITKVFVGGHSQGGFLTYSLLMNYPDLFAGAFPVSAGLIFQCEPSAYDKADLIAAQKRVPLAVVHAQNDGVVDPDMGKYAYESFDDAAFPALHFFNPPEGRHMFARLPVNQAIRWLEVMSADDPAKLLDAADQWLKENEPRDAAAALHRLPATLSPDLAKRRDEISARLESAAKPGADALRQSMKSKHGPQWIDEFLHFRAEYGQTAAAADILKSYQDLRDQQQAKADELFGKARAAYGRNDAATGKKLARQMIDECYASDKYRLVKGWLKD